jgi:hypothetical protein
MTDFIKTWSPILVPLLGLLAGGGWLQYYLKQRQSERERFRSVLEEFLLPLEGTLKTTKEIFDHLRDDNELRNLEYHPEHLRQFFASRPDDDPRKHLWKFQIEGLHEQNRRAAELIQKFRGKIVLKSFRDACDQLLLQVQQWQVVWNALIGTGTATADLQNAPRLYAPEFPAGLEAALQEEIREVRRRAGE